MDPIQGLGPQHIKDLELTIWEHKKQIKKLEEIVRLIKERHGQGDGVPGSSGDLGDPQGVPGAG